MTLGMQARLWFRKASTRQRVTVLTAGCVVVALIIASATVGSKGNPVASASSFEPGTSSASSAASTGSGAKLSSGTGSGGSSPLATTAGGASAGASGGASGIGSGAGAGAGSSGGSAGGAASGGGVSIGPVGSAAASKGPSAVRLLASDRGVTPTTITLGFLPANLAGLSQSGFAVNQRTDAAQYVQALAAYANAHGGVDGRKIIAVSRSTDPTSTSDQAAACQAMVSDDKVFGVIDAGAISSTPAMACIAQQNQTPFVHNTIWSTQWLAMSHGMEVGYPAAIDRISDTWTSSLAAMGWLAGHPTVGILGDQCEATEPIISNVLRPDLLAAGAGKVIIDDIGCDIQAVAEDPPTFATQFAEEGVTRVMLASNYVSDAVFMKAAQQELYHPKYSVSDWWQLSFDADATNFDPNQFNGAIAVTSEGLILPESGRPPRPGGQVCSQIATAAGLAPLEYTAPNTEEWEFCDNFFLMLAGLRAAGPNPTRTSWAYAIQHLGEINSFVYGPSDFKPGQTTGSDTVFTAEWYASCTCWKAVSASRPANA